MTADNEKPKLIILGTGFGGFSFLKYIDTDHYDVTVVSPRNHFLFTPLLTSTTVGTIEFRSIIEPVRTASHDVTYYKAACYDIDTEGQVVFCKNDTDNKPFELEFDCLIIAVGGTTHTFGIKGVREHSLFLKDLQDARNIRENVIACFEQAAAPAIDENERKRLLSFVVVGGGPTGVEFAGELHDFITKDVKKWFPESKDYTKITLLEASQSLLSTFDSTLSKYTAKRFLKQNIDVRTNSPVTEIRKDRVILEDGSEIPCGMTVWSAGIAPVPLLNQLDMVKDEHSFLLTDNYLKVTGQEHIFAIGDCAVIQGKDVPATAQVAQQQGKYLARSFNKMVTGEKVSPFIFRDKGMLAYIGGSRALADLPSVKGRGFAAWLFWRSAYLTKLVSWKNKVLVVFDWCKTFVFGRDISKF